MTGTTDDIAGRLERCWNTIDASGGSRDDTHIIAVSKRFSSRDIRRAYSVGVRDFGENYSQELLDKAEQLDDLPDIRWHMIGPVQSNKVAALGSAVSVWHSVGTEKTARKIASRAESKSVFVQVNSTGEENKSGCSLSGASSLVDYCEDLGLEVLGLMTMGPTVGDPRHSFSVVAALNQEFGFKSLSMGMSGDFSLAIELGATHLRLGTAIFGARPAS